MNFPCKLSKQFFKIFKCRWHPQIIISISTRFMVFMVGRILLGTIRIPGIELWQANNRKSDGSIHHSILFWSSSCINSHSEDPILVQICSSVQSLPSRANDLLVVADVMRLLDAGGLHCQGEQYFSCLPPANFGVRAGILCRAWGRKQLYLGNLGKTRMVEVIIIYHKFWIYMKGRWMEAAFYLLHTSIKTLWNEAI